MWAIIKDGASVSSASAGDKIEVLVSATPMYAESGGQVGDAGRIFTATADMRVDDVQKPTGGVHVHRGELAKGSLAVGDSVSLNVDIARRDAIRRNHSATHLLHHALREVLGEHVIQKGSLVAHDRLRFDFSHGKSLSEAERVEIGRAHV